MGDLLLKLTHCPTCQTKLDTTTYETDLTWDICNNDPCYLRYIQIHKGHTDQIKQIDCTLERFSMRASLDHNLIYLRPYQTNRTHPTIQIPLFRLDFSSVEQLERKLLLLTTFA